MMRRAGWQRPGWPSAVVFDLDGTLIDTATDILAALNHCMKIAGRPPVSDEEGRRAIGLGLEGMIETALAASGGLPDSAQLEKIKQSGVDYYDANLLVHTRPYPGVPGVLEYLSGRGVSMGICTNKRMSPALRILSALGLADYFGIVVARESCPQRKPHPEPLHAALRALGAGPEQAVMVGDSLIDVTCARAAGVAVVVVADGYAEVPVGELAADQVIEHCADLPRVLERMFSGRRINEPGA